MLCVIKPCTDVASNMLTFFAIGRSNCLRWLATEVSTCWIFYLRSFDISPNLHPIFKRFSSLMLDFHKLSDDISLCDDAIIISIE